MARSAPSALSTPSRALAVSAGLAILLVVAFGFWIRFAQGNGPVWLDQGWHDALAENRSPVADVTARALNTVGGTRWMTIITGATVMLFLLLRRWRSAVTLTAAVIAATLLSEVLKAVIARPRPSDAVLAVRGDSFPSGHSITAAVFATTLAILLLRTWIWVLSIAWIVAMAWSRTYLLVHWLSDTISGALLGVSIAALAIWLVTRFWPSRRIGEPDGGSPTA